MDNKETLENITTKDFISESESVLTIVNRHINNLPVSYCINIKNLSTNFISISKLRELENSLDAFRNDINKLVNAFKDITFLENNKYISKVDVERKKSNLITYDKLDQILANYLKESDINKSIFECKEHANNLASQVTTALINSAAMSRTATYNASKDFEEASDT